MSGSEGSRARGSGVRGGLRVGGSGVRGQGHGSSKGRGVYDNDDTYMTP